MDTNDMLLRAQSLLTTIQEGGWVAGSPQLDASIAKWLKDFDVQPDEEGAEG